MGVLKYWCDLELKALHYWLSFNGFVYFVLLIGKTIQNALRIPSIRESTEYFPWCMPLCLFDKDEQNSKWIFGEEKLHYVYLCLSGLQRAPFGQWQRCCWANRWDDVTNPFCDAVKLHQAGLPWSSSMAENLKCFSCSCFNGAGTCIKGAMHDFHHCQI